MPRRKYPWWAFVLEALAEPESEPVKAVFQRVDNEWERAILKDCIENRYQRRAKTIAMVARDHGTTENVVWKGLMRPFIVSVGVEMGVADSATAVKRRGVENIE